MCIISGDPHIWSFDGKMTHFQGSCKYNLATPVEGGPFQVNLKTEYRDDNEYGTYARYVEVRVYGHVIVLGRNNVVTVSNLLRNVGMWVFSCFIKLM